MKSFIGGFCLSLIFLVVYSNPPAIDNDDGPGLMIFMILFGLLGGGAAWAIFG